MSVLFVGTGANSATFDFQWRNAANTSILTGCDQMIFTSYDIDFTQRNSVATTDYSAIGTSSSPATRLTTSALSGTTSVFDPTPGTDSTFDEVRNAYAFSTVAGNYQQSVTVDKINGSTGNQLYMFSFRSPSPLISTIPDPSAALLCGLVLLGLLRRRR
jgi:hypothetical protein